MCCVYGLLFGHRGEHRLKGKNRTREKTTNLMLIEGSVILEMNLSAALSGSVGFWVFAQTFVCLTVLWLTVYACVFEFGI